MKKFLLLLLVSVSLAGCFKSDEIIGRSVFDIQEQYNRVVNLNALSVFQMDEEFVVVVANYEWIASKKATFSADRKNIDAVGLTLVKSSDLNQYVKTTLDEVQKSFGEFHVDIGSGFYIPAYITKDGFLICFYEKNNVISSILKWDLLTGEVVEEKDLLPVSK